jgi:hypothetical protein
LPELTLGGVGSAATEARDKLMSGKVRFSVVRQTVWSYSGPQSRFQKYRVSSAMIVERFADGEVQSAGRQTDE